MINNREIIARIDSLLKQKHLKRSAAYDYAGIAHNSFPNWCKTTNIPAVPLFKIAELLDVSIEWLLTGQERTAPEIPQDVLNLAFEINALPEVYKKIVFDTVQTLRNDVTEKEKEKEQSSAVG